MTGCDRDDVLDSMAAIEAVLRRDWRALTALLDAGSTRAMASLLASMLAAWLASGLGGREAALGELARMRADLMQAGGITP